MAKRKSSDFTLLLLVLILVVIGVIMVFSSSHYYALTKLNDSYYFLKRELLWATIGMIGMIFTMNFDYFKYRKLAPYAFGLSIVLLLLVLTPLGKEFNGARRWIGVGSFTIMPGEISKICAILFVASSLSSVGDKIKKFLSGVCPYILIIGIYMGLILLQPNMSTAVTIGAVIACMMFIAGMRWFHVIVMGMGGFFALAAMVVAAPYRMKRLTGFLDPFKDPMGTGYQVIQSLYALGSGGLFGVGLGRSMQKYLYIPEPQNDFIFAIIGEELGFVGCMVIIILYVLLIWRGVRIAVNAPDTFGCLLASGITSMVAVQTIINIAVATSSMPVTGMALPFISWGGNSLAIFMASIGILLNVSRYSNLDRS
ncbi:stage V sporulation protein E [Anaeromicrobium sediminis]|uniref:Probable peptidoglycan glycosyltransferase FtsW n=1 Tax=Anaeromicrobium sediminis TaxID=1478221 RepID=A0A267MIS5_9FIRM|nr:stage V sporulation protein E [Anaeromicrobium sediminis]PAB58828.1 stage V sporulation protein E [Anaeromicrobium sediminis]